jgi:uncharacterized membrane protein YraQ (UPF0718 family)
MTRAMGDHRPATLVRASLLGMASSSCSYAATALARSLFARGADFTTSIVFMVASTNLVVELGLVMWRLLGWQLAVAELIGGLIMIALLAAMLPKAASPALTEQARTKAQQPEDDLGAGSGADVSFSRRLRNPARRRAAARYAIADLTMLRRELVVGFVVAGFLAIGVPTRAWTSVFVTGHGVWTSIENAVVGPAVAMVSFVCSIGNVPLAAALWQRGVGYAGVLAFVFADLLSLPMVLIYRKLYGGRITLRLVAVMWLAMSTAGLLTEALMRAVGGVPGRRPRLVAPEHFAWDYTALLNVLALLVLAALLVARRGGAAETTDARDHCQHHQKEKAA